MASDFPLRPLGDDSVALSPAEARAMARADAEIEQLANQCYDAFVRYAARAAGPDLAKDHVQDVFFAVWRELQRPGRLEEIRSLRAHAMTCLKNRLKDAHRAGIRTDNYAIRERGTPGFLVEEEPAGERLVLFEEQIAVVFRILKSLPKRCREVIQLRFLEVPPLTRPEIARRMGCKPGTIGVHLNNAMLLFRARLTSLGYENLPPGGSTR